jgi:hypothetical protein
MRSTRKHRVRAEASGKSAVVDAFMDLYVEWRQQVYELDVVYRRWDHAATAEERRTAFGAYSRALDAEERAALRFGEFSSYAARTLSA